MDFNFYKLLINNLNNLNFEYVIYIAHENINIFYFLFFSLGSIIFIEKINYNFVLKKNIFNTKKIIASSIGVIIFILTNFNPSHTHLTLVDRYKHLTDTWTSNDLVGYGVKYISQYVDNSFFRNDNWFNTIKYSYLYLDSNPPGKRKLAQFDTNLEFESFKNFGEVINKKKI